MTFKKRLFTFITSLLFGTLLANAQQITVNNSVSPQTLVQDNLVQGCIETSNISSPINGDIVGLGSYGVFNSNNSNFPFENGIVLTTGNAASGGNGVNTNILNDGDTTWGTDPDLELALGLPANSTLNATSIAFTFVSSTDQISFNYILASEEYFANNPCLYSDAFAFLIREAGTGNPYQNIAIIPGTADTVNTQNIRPEISGVEGCPAQNETFFEGFNIGDTNYNGRTTILNASASIQPNVNYEIKIIIADQTDENFDSAVFIQPNTLNLDLDLGEDISICAEEFILDANINEASATYTWFFNDTLIAGETMPTLTITESGDYGVEIEIPLGNSFCVLQDEVNVSITGEQTADPISDFALCDPDGNGQELFDLTLKNSDVVNAVPSSSYTVSYYFSSDDAQNEVNPITNPITNSTNPETIFVRIVDNNSGCLAFADFNLVVNPLPVIVDPTPLDACDDNEVDGITNVNLNLKNDEITNSNADLNVTYHISPEDAANGVNPLPIPYLATDNETVYVNVTNQNTGCSTTTSLIINVLENPVINTEIQYIDACDSDYDGFATFDLTSIISNVISDTTGLTITFHLTPEDAATGANPIADATNYENVEFQEQTVYIRVENTNSGCASVAPIEIHSNLLLTGVEVENQSICDDNNDGIEEINLESLAIRFINNIPNVTITFYETEEDRDNQVNPIDTSVDYEIILADGESATLYVGITSPTCYEVNEFIIEFVDVTNFDPIPDQEVCDDNQDGIVEINLSQYNSLITQGLGGFNISYFLTEQDAIDNINVLPTLYTNTDNPTNFTVYPRISSATSGCISAVIPFEITVIPVPVTNTPDPILICDTDQDGFFIVNLNDAIPQIVSNPNSVNISIHNTLNDALNNVNPIPNPTNYNAQTENIFFRIENPGTDCFVTEQLQITVSTQHIFSTITPFYLCENNSDGFTDFILATKDAEILNGNTGQNVIYFESQADADNRVNFIPKFLDYENTSNPQTIFVRVENSDNTDCYSTSSFTIEVGSNPEFNEPEDIVTCDDSSNDGTATFDLSTKIPEITMGSTENLNITFYDSFDNAENSTNPLPLNYNNVVNPQEIYVQINNGTLCNSITTFQVTVIPVPGVDPIPSIEECDDDGIGTFDLTISEQSITDSRVDNLSISYFENLTDAENNTNPIATPEAYTNTSNPQTAYMKVVNTLSNCEVLAPINITLNLPPAFNAFGVYEVCDNPNSNVQLTEVEPLLINNPTNEAFTYFSNFSDAENNINPLDPNYTYTGNDTIFVRIENTITTCFTVYDFTLQINPLPVANQPADLEACDDVSDDDVEDFNLESQTSIVLGSQDPTNFTVTYYLSSADAITNSNPLNSIYTGSNGETIYVRIENNTTGCFSTTSFNLLVNPYPNVPQPLVECDEDYDGLTTFNLTEAEADIFEVSNPNDSFTYYETEQDLNNQTNAIPNPTNYTNTSNPQTVYILVFNSNGNCSNSITLDLNVNFPPAINEFDNDIFDTCFNDTSSFDLTQLNSIITNSSINVSYSYFTDPTDAEANTNAITNPENYIYTSNLDQLYIRVQFTTSQCFYVYPFQLRVNPLPEANQPPVMVECDTDFDGLFNFNFTTQNAAILGNQNPANYTVSYYNSLTDAENATQVLSADYLAANNETIYARVQNNATGCFNTTSFNTIVNRKPIINIPPQVLCLNDLPLIISAETGFPSDNYEWRDEAGNLISIDAEAQITQIGNYTIVITTQNGCQTADTISVSESQSADNVSVDVLHFSDPSTVTVNFTGIGNYTFQLDDGEPQTSPIFEDVAMGDHTITVIDENGCEPSILEFLVIDIPKHMTPNNDDAFDNWHIVGIEDPRLTGTTIYIHDRYGKLLKQIGYGTPGWDGTYRGYKMPASDYWYTADIKFEGKSFQIKGHFALRR